jgi:hypothetical protein
VQPARLDDPLARFSRNYQTSREPLCRAVTPMPRFPSRVTVGARGTHSPRLVAAGSHDRLWDARAVRPVHIRCPQYRPGEDGSNVLGGHAMQGQVDFGGAPTAGRDGNRSGLLARRHLLVTATTIKGTSVSSASPGCRPVWYRPRHEPHQP